MGYIHLIHQFFLYENFSIIKLSSKIYVLDD